MTTKKDGVLLQLLGTEWGRKVLGDDIWIRILRKRIERADDGQLIVVGDCRFKNEFDAFPDALRVRLEAKSTVRKDRTQSWRDNTDHQSEVDLDQYGYENKFDLVIETDGIITSDGAVEMILAQLTKNNWKEKRK